MGKAHSPIGSNDINNILFISNYVHINNHHLTITLSHKHKHTRTQHRTNSLKFQRIIIVYRRITNNKYYYVMLTTPAAAPLCTAAAPTACRQLHVVITLPFGRSIQPMPFYTFSSNIYYTILFNI